MARSNRLQYRTFGDGLVCDDQLLTENGTDGVLDGRSMNKLDDEQVRLNRQTHGKLTCVVSS